jgi:predicted polyphosphate/ATP-dependent NAD kinase
LKRIGLIVNPIAGIGGRVGLKGSDGEEIKRKALQMGAKAEAPKKTIIALKEIAKGQRDVELITYPEPMGELEAKQAGIIPRIIGKLTSTETTSKDTENAAKDLLNEKIDLILFAGGDGTARDIFNIVGSRVPVLGIPAGVKIHSGVFAASPRAAGRLVLRFLDEEVEFREAEVMDIDEEAFRRNILSAKLYGYMITPFERTLLQGSKEITGINESLILEAIAADIIEEMNPDTLYIIGPGTTTKPIFDELGIEKTLLGVDIVKDKILVAKDVNEERILEHLNGKAKIIVSVIGGQGFIFGRGNQQVSPIVIRKVGKENIIILATPNKLATLKGKNLRVDTGDPDLDDFLSGYYKVITGYARRTMYRVG